MKLDALLKKPLWLYAAVSGLAVVLMAVASAVWAPQWQNWEERLASRTWSLANPQATERRVVVVDIDEKSTQALGPWPWPRERVATLLSGLDAYGVNLKVVDVLFEGAQDAAQDQKLALALKAGAPTVISQLFALNPQAQLKSGQLAGAMGTCPANSTANQPFGTPAFGFMGAETLLAQSSAGVGHITPIIDADGSIRRVPAVVCYEGNAYPALAVAGLAAATGAQPVWRNTQAGLFSTGSAPGRPSVTGSIFVFGSSPKWFGLAENNLVFVSNSTCTSRPTTISQPFGSSVLCCGADDALLMTHAPIRQQHGTWFVHQVLAQAPAHRLASCAHQFQTEHSLPHGLQGSLEW
mgnify:CR=1 FL=1